MFDDSTLAKARTEVQRLNQQLAELHLEEQRCQLKRSRLEAEKARIQSFVDMGELALRFQAQTKPGPAVSYVPVFDDQPNGPKFVVPGTPPSAPTPNLATLVKTSRAGRREPKPADIPSVATMVATALRELGQSSRPTEITAYIRSKWWPDVRGTAITPVVWRMAKSGHLTQQDGRYGLNGVGH